MTPPRPPLRLPRPLLLQRPAVRAWLLTTAMAVAALALFRGPVAEIPALAAIDVPWWLLTLSFACTEAFVVHLHLRRDAHSVSLSELPLVVGLAALSPLALVAARVLGAGSALAFGRKLAPTKLAFNCALFALETGVAILLHRAVLADGAVTDPRGWLATVVAVVTIDALGTLLITVVIWTVEGEVRLEMLREAGTVGVFLAACNAAIAVLVVTVLATSPQGIIPLIAVTLLMYVGYRGHVQLRNRHASLQLLHRFTGATARSGDTRTAAAGMLAEIRELLRCEVAEFALIAPDGQVALRIRLSDDGVEGDETGGGALPPLRRGDIAWCLGRAGDDAAAALVDAHDHGVLGFLRGVDVRGAVTAPVQLAAGEVLRGMVIAANRLGAVSQFDEEDARLLGSLAGHAAVALENGRLVERLRTEAEEKAHQALHDGLTGLPNRIMLQRRIAEVVEGRAPRAEGEEQRGRRVGDGAAVLLLDLDRFKEVNDTLGHRTGDLLLQEVSRRLGRAVRTGDTVARLGGDEFAVVAPGIGDAEDALALAGRIAEELARPWELEGITLDLHASVGIALSPEHGTTADDLLQRADVAMYVAKDGDGRVALYTPEEDHHSHRRLSLSAELRQAVHDGTIDVHFQPKVRLADGAVIGVEALARWEHPELGYVRPDEFIPLAEQTGLIGPLTTAVIRRSLSAVVAWREAGLDLSVAVNLSPRTVIDLGFPDELRAMLREADLPADRLTLEVTESSMLADTDRAVRVLDALSALGASLSIDDFGTGFSSLAYLRRLPLDEVKIDRGFIRSMLQNGNDAVIARTIVELGHNLGMAVVAEGVEDAATADALLAMGCDVAQGYLWSPAIPGEGMAAWVAQHDASHRPARPHRSGLQAVRAAS